MKRHLVNIWFEMPNGQDLAFEGYVTTRVISPAKLFKAVFGMEMPDGATASFFRPTYKSTTFCSTITAFDRATLKHPMFFMGGGYP